MRKRLGRIASFVLVVQLCMLVFAPLAVSDPQEMLAELIVARIIRGGYAGQSATVVGRAAGAAMESLASIAGMSDRIAMSIGQTYGDSFANEYTKLMAGTADEGASGTISHMKDLETLVGNKLAATLSKLIISGLVVSTVGYDLLFGTYAGEAHASDFSMSLEIEAPDVFDNMMCLEAADCKSRDEKLDKMKDLKRLCKQIGGEMGAGGTKCTFPLPDELKNCLERGGTINQTGGCDEPKQGPSPEQLQQMIDNCNNKPGMVWTSPAPGVPAGCYKDHYDNSGNQEGSPHSDGEKPLPNYPNCVDSSTMTVDQMEATTGPTNWCDS